MTAMEEPTAPLATVTTDRCPNCGSAMAADQRYCIECGERRSGGGLREAMPRTQTVTSVAAAGTARRRVLATTANGSFIAGVGTLLLAMGVGVLIGRTGQHSANSAANPPVRVVTVPTLGGGAAATTAGTASSSSATTKAAHHKKVHVKAAKAPVTALQKTAAQSGVKLPPAKVKVGGACAKGTKGCQGGKFTGGFFGGG